MSQPQTPTETPEETGERKQISHASGCGEYTLRSARWINSPSQMREEATTRSFMTEMAAYEGGEE